MAEEDGEIVGHALYSPMTAVEGSGLRILGLGPLAVVPAHQRRGVGSALMHYSIEKLCALGFDLIVLLGSTVYYPRFGFVQAETLNLHPADEGIPADHFQALVLNGQPPAEALHLRFAPQFFL